MFLVSGSAQMVQRVSLRNFSLESPFRHVVVSVGKGKEGKPKRVCGPKTYLSFPSNVASELGSAFKAKSLPAQFNEM